MGNPYLACRPDLAVVVPIVAETLTQAQDQPYNLQSKQWNEILQQKFELNIFPPYTIEVYYAQSEPLKLTSMSETGH